MKQQTAQYNMKFIDVTFWHNAIVHWVTIAVIFINIGVVILFAFYVHPSDLPLRLQYNVFLVQVCILRGGRHIFCQ
jgi:hypothetical protein